MNNPYDPPNLPQEKEEVNINGVYKEFIAWSLLIAALFFLLDSIRAVSTGIVKSVLLVLRYIVDLNN